MRPSRGRLEIAESPAEVSGEPHFWTTQTHQVRQVALLRFLVEMLAQHLEVVEPDPDALVFTSPEGHAFRSVWRRRFWRPAVDAADVEPGLRIHDLRHTTAAMMVVNGANVKAVQSPLGHSSATITLDTHEHLIPDDLDRLAEGPDQTRSDAIADLSRTSRDPEIVCLAG